jgi:nitrite reductase/ring-hydroxylating ferredoxin subunit/uncharacterized membrane protein
MTILTKSETGRSWMETPPVSPMIKHLSGELVARMPWLDTISTPLSSWIARFYGNPSEGRYRVKDLINGVWFGHPLHPVFVTVPLGAWTTTLMFDIAWLKNRDESSARAADATMWLGLAGAAVSAITGATNWLDTDGMEKRTGMLHALLNTGIAATNLLSALLRLIGMRRTAITLATVGYAVALYSAYLGGELSFSDAVEVNHVAWESGPDDFVPVMNEQDLVPGKLTRVDADGMSAVLYKDGHAIYALAATCSHLGGPLDEGQVKDGVVYCPWHNSGFRLCDGSVVHSPSVYAQPTFAVRIRDSKIELRRLEHA